MELCLQIGATLIEISIFFLMSNNADKITFPHKENVVLKLLNQFVVAVASCKLGWGENDFHLFTKVTQ